jgi:sigma-B regulation protein RsbU (phosphoserine phosphatase)
VFIRFMILAACVVINLAALRAVAQTGQGTFDATKLQEPAELNSAWLFHPGDDPTYARTDFDDSQWMTFDPNTDIKTILKTSHPDVIWYRMHVKVSPGQTGLALKELNLSRAFEVYVNGERLMASGQIAPYSPYTLSARLLARIPARMLATGSLVIALRVYIAAAEWGTQGPGLSTGNLSIGQESTLYREDWLAIIGENSLTWLNHVLNVCLGVIALVLFAAQRRNTEYLWIAAAGLITLLEMPQLVISAFTNIPLYWQVLTALLRLVMPYVLAALYFSFVHQRIGWRWRIFLIFTGVTNTFSGLQGVLFTSSAPLQLFGNLPVVILFSVILPIVLAIHWRRGNREAGILLIPIVLFSLYIYIEMGFGALFQIPGWRDFAIRGLNTIDRFPAGPFSISLNGISGILSVLSLALIMLIRSTHMSRRQAILESEFAAAEEVQNLLLPEHREVFPGFTVDSVYEPAQQVGGDFFQILPAGEGGLVLVVGDVAGKGLPAAMLVSVLVGAICGLSEYTQDPAELLSCLNERLVGRAGDGFSTALAAHITSDGRVTVANAGHLSPYLDGKEVELQGALPLGVAKGARYETTQFHLASGSRLTFYSDGVVEAMNQRRELFGFERAKELSTEPAAAIAEAAKKFGQEDDITVVTITRAEAVASAA